MRSDHEFYIQTLHLLFQTLPGHTTMSYFLTISDLLTQEIPPPSLFFLSAARPHWQSVIDPFVSQDMLEGDNFFAVFLLYHTLRS